MIQLALLHAPHMTAFKHPSEIYKISSLLDLSSAAWRSITGKVSKVWNDDFLFAKINDFVTKLSRSHAGLLEVALSILLRAIH